MILPTKAEVNGKIYDINTDYKVAIQCYHILEDDTITDEERCLAIIYKIFGFVPENNVELFLEKCIKFLEGGSNYKNDDCNSAPDMDFDYDEAYIEASFMSDYGIDLSTKKLHFWKFIALLEGLTSDCVLSRVREIRGYDLNDITDHKQRQKMEQAKMALALPHKRTAEEQKAVDEFEALFE